MAYGSQARMAYARFRGASATAAVAAAATKAAEAVDAHQESVTCRRVMAVKGECLWRARTISDLQKPLTMTGRIPAKYSINKFGRVRAKKMFVGLNLG
jgi:hypothetical protein